MTEKTERALSLAEQIFQLRAQLAELEREFAVCIGERVPVAATSVAIVGDDESAPTADRIRAFFGRNPREKYTVMDLVKALPGIDARVIRSTLTRLARKGQGVTKVDRGYYSYQPSGEALAKVLDMIGHRIVQGK
jgi:hypothetical protein